MWLSSLSCSYLLQLFRQRGFVPIHFFLLSAQHDLAKYFVRCVQVVGEDDIVCHGRRSRQSGYAPTRTILRTYALKIYRGHG
jgi:hypothetical protein